MIALTWIPAKLAWRESANQALAWWLGELSGLLPATLRSRLASRPRTMLRLDFARDGAVLTLPGRDRSSSTSVPVALDIDARPLLDGAVATNAPVQIRLDEGLLFRPVIDLPLAAENTLESILRHQLERLVPLDPATLRFVWRVVERDAPKNRLKVEVSIVKCEALDRALTLARTLHLQPQAILIEQAGQPAAFVWRSTTAGQVNARERRFRRALEVTAICLLLAAYSVFITHLGSRRAVLRELVADLRTHIQTVEALSARAATAEKTLAEVNAKLTPPGALAVLDALTRVIPLDGSVSEFHLQGTKIEISGVASHATALLAAIDHEPMFEDSSFMAPIVAAGPGTGERYQLAFRIKGTPP